MALPTSHPDRVFINCPFDRNYKPLFDAIAFAVHDLGFQARHALATNAQDVVRLRRIAVELGDCRYSVHDLSRVEVSRGNNLPRFNMPFEAGMAYCLHHFGDPATRHHMLLLDAVSHRYQASLSDAAGLDPGIHARSAEQIIAKVRQFLVRSSGRPGLPGGARIFRRFETFKALLPLAARQQGVTTRELLSWDYVNDFQQLISAWIRANQA